MMIKLKEVKKMTSLSRSSIYAYIVLEREYISQLKSMAYVIIVL